MIKHLYDLIPLLAPKDKLKMVVVMAHDDHVIEAIAKVIQLNYVDVHLIGDRDRLNGLCLKHHIINQVTIEHEEDPENAVELALTRVRNKEAHVMMKGIIDSKVMMKGIVNSETGIKQSRLLSHIAIAEIPTLDRLIIASDMAMNIQPSVEQKIQIIENIHAFARLLKWDPLLIGLLSSAEKVNPKVASSLEAQEIKEFFSNYPLPNTIVDGPFALDNLASVESCFTKGITSPVGGHSNVWIFPNLDAGNIFYKSITFLAQAELAGVIFGAQVPIVLTSRSDSATTKMFSIMLALVLAHAQLNTNH